MPKNSNRSDKHKPKKPSKDYPLYPHANGQWAKKVRGKTYFFGVWEDPHAALVNWLAQKDNLLAGVVSTATTPGALTVGQLCDLVYHAKSQEPKLAKRSLDEYDLACKRITKFFGKDRVVETIHPLDFAKFRLELAKGVAVSTLDGRIGYIRAVFQWADGKSIFEKSLTKLWGDAFAKPTRKDLRKNKANKERWVEPAQLRLLLSKARPQMRAMLYLSINAGFGNSDCATLPLSAIDLQTKWIRWARPKTGMDRKCPLWPETVKAIKDWLEIRPEPKSEANADLVFLTRFGNQWESTSTNNPISKEFTKLRKECKITTPGVSFYSARHVFQTVAELEDKLAATVIMGHVDPTIQAVYRNLRLFPDKKLLAVSRAVKRWLKS